MTTFLSFYFMLVFASFLVFTSCEEASFVGLEIQPSSDRFVVKLHEDPEISSSVWVRDSIVALDYRHSLLGVLNDPLFGRLSSSFLTEVGIDVQFDYGIDPVAESLVLYLRIESIYGDELAPQEIRVYEVSDTIHSETYYYSNFDPWTIVNESDLLAEYYYEPVEGDTLIAVPITDPDIQDKLLFAPDSVMQTISAFLEYFKGIYVTASPLHETGSVYTVNLNHNDSRLSLYYNNEEFRDTILSFDYIITEGASRLNLFEQDYSEAVFYDILGETETDDPVFYVQGGAGVMSRLDFDNLDTWRDSMDMGPVSINQARLILPVEDMDETAGNLFPPAPRLVLFERTEEGHLTGILDMVFGNEYFDGVFDETLGQYQINVTNFVQSYIKEEKKTSSLYLVVRDSGMVPNRVVLKNRKHQDGGARLEITYTKH